MGSGKIVRDKLKNKEDDVGGRWGIRHDRKHKEAYFHHIIHIQ